LRRHLNISALLERLDCHCFKATVPPHAKLLVSREEAAESLLFFTHRHEQPAGMSPRVCTDARTRDSVGSVGHSPRIDLVQDIAH